MTESRASETLRQDDCRLFAITQYQCSPEDFKVVCWPLERIFRQCGRGPAVEVTNHVIRDENKKVIGVEAKVIGHAPKGKKWADLR